MPGLGTGRLNLLGCRKT
ncbi:unnamed protein product [Gulo gulo]|uniref:Uncharacterized protein n=1 Tax=Gulo gulo TaxID=48420 RepID=A0A9X9LR32_GULGU|nr:unnamed protein product [Gulo gulo]